MADRIIKPDSGDQLVLQDEGGTSAISIAAAGDVSITEDMILGDGKYIGPSSAPSAMLFDSSGAVTKPSQPAFSVYPTSSQTSPANAATVVWGTEVYDIGGNFASNTFTAPVTGKYQFNVILRANIVDKDNTFSLIKLVTSKLIYTCIVGQQGAGTDPTYWTYQLSTLADMDSSDTCLVRWEFSGGVTCSSIDLNSFFNGFLVC